MDDVVALPSRHRLDVVSYARMIEAGIFGKGDRIELIDGALIDMAPIGQVHEANVSALTRVLVLAAGERAIVSPQNSVRLDLFNAPEPDLALFQPRADFYATGDRAAPADVLLLVEVSDSSLQYDRTVKLPLYARSGIVEVWIVDVAARVLQAYRDPRDGAYGTMTTHQAGERLALVADSAIVVPLLLMFG